MSGALQAVPRAWGGQVGRWWAGGASSLCAITHNGTTLYSPYTYSPARAQATRQRMSRARLMRRFHTSAGSTEVIGSDVLKLCPSLQSAGKGGDMEAGQLMRGADERVAMRVLRNSKPSA